MVFQEIHKFSGYIEITQVMLVSVLLVLGLPTVPVKG